MDQETRLQILTEVIPVAMSFQATARRRILIGTDVHNAMRLLGYHPSLRALSAEFVDSSIKPVEPELSSDVASNSGDSYEEDTEAPNEASDNENMARNTASATHFNENLLLTSKERQAQKYIFGSNPSKDSRLETITLNKARKDIQIILAPQIKLIVNLTPSQEWTKTSRSSIITGKIGVSNTIPFTIAHSIDESATSLTSALAGAVEDVCSGCGLGGVASVLLIVDSHTTSGGGCALLAAARVIDAVCEKLVASATPVYVAELFALLVTALLQRTLKSKRFKIYQDEMMHICGILFGCLARFAFDTSTPKHSVKSTLAEFSSQQNMQFLSLVNFRGSCALKFLKLSLAMCSSLPASHKVSCSWLCRSLSLCNRVVDDLLIQIRHYTTNCGNAFEDTTLSRNGVFLVALLPALIFTGRCASYSQLNPCGSPFINGAISGPGGVGERKNCVSRNQLIENSSSAKARGFVRWNQLQALLLEQRLQLQLSIIKQCALGTVHISCKRAETKFDIHNISL